MRTEGDSEWYAIQSRAGAEEVAAQTLDSLGLQTFLPRARSVHNRRGRPVEAIRSLFPCYCFARFEPRLHLHAVRYSRGVVRVVGGDRTPWPVDESIIEGIRERLNERGLVELHPPQFQPGAIVRINAGPLEGWTGMFDSEVDDRTRVVILLHAIQQARVVTRRDQLELADAN